RYLFVHPAVSFLHLLTVTPTRSTLFPYTTLFRSQRYIYDTAGIYFVSAVSFNSIVFFLYMGSEVFRVYEYYKRILLCVLSANSLDRKSTRLNSSHVSISYAVFFLKKKMIH